MADWQSKTRESFQQRNEESDITTKITSLGETTSFHYRYGINTYGLGVYGIGIGQNETTGISAVWQVPNDTVEIMTKTPTRWQEKNE